jgi:hypothetical protein
MASVTTQEVQMLYKNTHTKSIGGITIDAFLNENYGHSADVTKYPIEDGSEISDHVVQNQDVLTISGLVSKTVLTEDYSKTDPPVDRVGEYYNKLLALKEAGGLITVVAGLRTWTNMVITDFSLDRSKDNGGCLEFSMTLTKVKIVKSETTAISTNAGGSTSAKRQAQSKKEVGKVSTTEVTNTTKKSNILDIAASQLGITRS